ncbi:acetoacetate-CoA ligase [Pseudovirgaria hyperparasitica]|uniref:Acetoacetate-CoA ligase n=1 Tax=Pseudovirgaria hyperparasitica TaxID=470096 RepID=A0A6A6WKF3_9PEZI|nr:acetoacetate-CoA ligase [Pseudovirgaria hyperparasitica]KAF2762664.1 acetoacetate-CoA ligase [Pseudovirgaria hyperparasitica]
MAPETPIDTREDGNGTSADTADTAEQGELLWQHADPKSTNMWRFLLELNRKYKMELKDYKELYDWSVDNIAEFWGEVWQWVGIRASKQYDQVVDAQAPMFPRPAFFSGASLNFAENLLFPLCEVDETAPAILAATETDRETVSWAELRQRVAKLQASLAALGLEPGDRVAGYVANHTNALVAMLATTALGGIWTAVSPDTGVTAVLDRMKQIEPKVLFSDNASYYNGKSHPVIPKLAEIVSGLPTLEAAVVFETISGNDMTELRDIKLADNLGSACTYDSFLRIGPPVWNLKFTQLPPDHPVYILYSSGTTGAPKCIVHGAIGTLVQHKKEHIIHSSIVPGSRFFYFTTCTWMMWHWLVSGLAAGAILVLYDGSPFRSRSPDLPGHSIADDLAMPRLIDELSITHFGTSAKYLSVLEQKALFPHKTLPLSSLQAIYSTGSPLAPSTFKWVYTAFPPTLTLSSITGGTDIISLFGAPCPLVPVFAGEIQAPGLGMRIRAFDHTATDITLSGAPGDLVCTRPFPCQPVSFFADDDPPAAKYRASYFDLFPGVWHHGDFVRFNPRTRGLVMLGRSDGVLKPQGVRFGSAEIYNVLLAHFGNDDVDGGVADGLCVGRRRPGESDETVVLFVKMVEGRVFGEGLAERVRRVVRRELSARHVPGVVDVCVDIPVTTNGKKVEGAVKQILCGMNVKTSASVANPECLDWYREWARTH